MRCKCAGDGWGVSGLVHYCIKCPTSFSVVLQVLELVCGLWSAV